MSGASRNFFSASEIRFLFMFIMNRKGKHLKKWDYSVFMSTFITKRKGKFGRNTISVHVHVYNESQRERFAEVRFLFMFVFLTRFIREMALRSF